MREMDLGPRILNDYDSLVISVKQIEPVDYKLQNKSSHVIRTNWNNDLFTVNQWQLFDCKKNEINDSSNKLLFGGNLAPIIIPFKNNQFKLFGQNIDYTIDYSDSERVTKQTSLFAQHIDAMNYQSIILDSMKLIFKFPRDISDITYGRINDSTYLIVVCAGKICYLFRSTSKKDEFIGEINLSKELYLIDTSNFKKDETVSAQIGSVSLSNNLKHLVVHYQETKYERQKISQTFYNYQASRTVQSLILFNFDWRTQQVHGYNTIAKSDNPTITYIYAKAYIPVADFWFDASNRYMYFIQNGNTTIDTEYLYRYDLIKSQREMVLSVYGYNLQVLCLTYWGDILINKFSSDFNTIKQSQLINIYNPSASLSSLKFWFSKIFPRYPFILGDYISPMVHNYLYIKPEITTACKARVKFRNFTNMERGFTRFEYHIAKDTAGKKWDVLTEFEPEYVFQEKGKYAFKVRGFCDDGYSEWYEDSVIIEAGEQFDVLPNHTPIIQFASTDNNKQNSIQWQSLSGATEYSIFKDNVFIGRTTQTKLLDSMKEDIQGPHEYHVVAYDACMHSSAKSATAKTIFLTVRKESSNNVLLERSELEWNEYANGSDLVLNYEGYSSIVNENWWQKMYTGTPTTTVDAQFVTFGKEGKCYRVEGNLSSGFKTSSNEACLFYSEKVLIPTAFTPNGDGLNDAFEISGNGISEIEMAIYNRWGEKIHSDNGKNIRWQPQNTIPSNEMYTYVIRCRFSNGGWEVYKGTVLLLR
jgi:gliding motility-associated-like protein